ncbi:MAG: ATP-binding protein [Patescibacteria group bacterium]
MAPPREVKAYAIKLLLLGAAYASLAYLSFFLVPVGGSGASLVWPPAALALGALFLFGVELWPALLVSFFALLLAKGITPPLAAAIAIGNVLEALAGVYILRRLNFDALFNRLQDALVFALTSFGAAFLSSTFISLALRVLTDSPFDSQLWVGLWVGHMVSLLSFGPFMVRWAYKPLFTRTRREWVEGAGLFGAIIALNVLVYWTPYTTLGSVSLLYFSIVPLMWAALRTGPRGMTFALALMAAIASSGILFGYGPLAHAPNLPQSLFSIQLVIGTLSLIFLIFVAIVEERKEATKALQNNVEQFREALEKIRAEDQAKADFIAILAHELRNPLSPLLSGVELMKARAEGPANVLQMMGAHLNTMARLLDDLLDMSRISQKRFQLQKHPVKISAVVAQSLEMVSPYFAERGHSLITVLPEEELWTNGDQVRLVQIVVNLLNNAAKYTNPGGTIRLEARRLPAAQAGHDDDVVITVSDTGTGIDPARLKKIFEPFGISDSGTNRAGGLHIGLSLAKRMAEMHHGTLAAASPGVGRGSTFTVTLPLAPMAPLIPPEVPRDRRSRFSKEALGKSRALGTLLVLVVDDNEAAAASLCRLLEHNGHQTLVAHDATQALLLCEKYFPTVALLDIGLPDMDGYELARRLRQKFGDGLMLVALTGYGQDEDKRRAREAGFDEHLTKPVSIVDVERVLLDLNKS